jgi:hypothetical protein
MAADVAEEVLSPHTETTNRPVADLDQEGHRPAVAQQESSREHGSRLVVAGHIGDRGIGGMGMDAEDPDAIPLRL